MREDLTAFADNVGVRVILADLPLATVTVILLSYQRQPNVRRIIPALRSQTVKPYIALVNNGPPYVAECLEQEPDTLWVMPQDVGPFVRYFVAYDYVGWLYFQDDDVVPTDDTFLEDMLELAKKRPDAITGVWGRHISPTPPHYLHPDTVGPTNMIKAISMMVHRRTLGRMRFPSGSVGRCSDIWFSLETSGGSAIHFSDLSFAGRLEQLPQWGVALSHEPEHYDDREMCSAVWWQQHLEGA